MRALVLYATVEGQTQKIAERIMQRFAKQGVPADCCNVDRAADELIAVDAYDALIAGASIHYGHFDAALANYLGRYRGGLTNIPTAFYAVSMAAASDKTDERQHIRKIADEYLKDIGWQPDITQHFSGAIKYTQYSWWKRRLMRSIAKREAGPTDTRFDYEFTRWNEVDAFADRFIALIDRQRDGGSHVSETGKRSDDGDASGAGGAVDQSDHLVPTTDR